MLRTEQRIHDDDTPTLRALGASSRQIGGAASLRVLPAAVAGVAVGVVLAVVLSPRFPIGIGRQLEFDGGVHADVLVLAAGVVIALLMLIGLAFGGACMALTTYMRSWQDFEFVTLATMPMFLFSATFFPVTAYPTVVRWIVEATPLYRGVVLCRELTTGSITWASAVSVVYLVVMGLVGLAVVRRRLDSLLLT